MPELSTLVRRLTPVADPALVLIVLLLSLLPLVTSRGAVPAWAYVLVVAECLPLTFRRRWPLIVISVSGVLAVIYGVAPLPDPAVPYAPLVGIYSAAAHSGRLGANVAGVISAIAITGSLLLDPTATLDHGLVLLAISATAWLLGDGARRRREVARTQTERADHLERTRAAEAAAAVADERNRIAREMHDVIAHHLSMMVVQAEAGPVVVASDPGRATAAFDAISAAGKQALTEMRRLLGGPQGRGDGAAAPAAGRADLAELVDGVRSAGIDVRMTSTGPRQPLPAAVDLSVYRLVQEALTNCVRHGEPTRVDVNLVFEPRELSVTVADDGVGAAKTPHTGGHGLVAMRERVTLIGGTLAAGPRADRGWAVRAVLPLERS
ncbi:sensor histidine kinase [Fodinicola feengrottensis]|uniref:sensor histidine kinase n=1 Tax=Fodinicola feengrottensis TaxID=435914 RepID=UPI0013D67E48|nr:histidine kinase [Fodinicola feengrottensis]